LFLGCQGEYAIPTPVEELDLKTIQVAVNDAKNPNLSIAGLQVRVEGDAVDASQLYAEGRILKAGVLLMNNQSSQISCKNPGSKNALFTVWASAPGYISNFKHVRVSALDSLQYVDVALVKITDVPEDVKWQNNLITYLNTSTLVPGGLQSAHTNQGDKTFLLGAAVQSINGNPSISLDLILGEDTHNPETGLDIQAGDLIELWFLAENTGSWIKLQEKTIRTDGLGRKFVTVALEKAGTLLAGYGLDPCLEPLMVSLEKPSIQDQTLCVRLLQGNTQILADRRIPAKSHGPFTMYLPKNIDYTISLHDGITSESSIIYQNRLPNCAHSAVIKVNN
jgi:hypothetical protein